MRRLTSLLLVSYLVLAWLSVAASPATAQEWSRFRGPNGAGQSDATTVPDKWTEKDYNWITKLPGIGHSSPVLWGKKIFLTSANPQNGTRIAMCVNAKDG